MKKWIIILCCLLPMLSGDQQLFRSREQFFARAHGGCEVLITVKVQNAFSVTVFSFTAFSDALLISSIVGHVIDHFAVSDVHIAGCVGDDHKVPAIEGIVVTVQCDPGIDIHELSKESEVVPVIIGQPGGDSSTVDRARRHILVDRDPAAGEKYT